MPLDPVACKRLIVLHEGRRARAYPDSLGIMTVGIGCNLQNPGIPDLFASLSIDYIAVRSQHADLTDAQIDAVFLFQYNIAVEDAKRLLRLAGELRDRKTSFDLLPDIACSVLVDMSFQMGGERLRGFAKMLGAFAEQDWDTASTELLDSDYAKQAPQRAKTNASLLRHLVEQPITITPIDLTAELNLTQPTSRTKKEDSND